MNFAKKEVYIETSAGDIILVEISENNGNIRIMAKDNFVDLGFESAIDLADAVLELVGESYGE